MKWPFRPGWGVPAGLPEPCDVALVPAPSGLSCQGLRHAYGSRQVLSGLELTVQQGEVVGLLGSNGAGKSTCMAALSGVLEPDAGSLHLDGAPLRGLPLFRRAQLGLGYLPQEPSLFLELSVIENLILGLGTRPAATRRSLAWSHLEACQLQGLARQPAGRLSGGERRRLELARLLASEPRYLLLDEPFAGLDGMSVARLEDVIRGQAQRGVGILLTDHQVEACARCCHRLLLLYDGRVVADSSQEAAGQAGLLARLFRGGRPA